MLIRHCINSTLVIVMGLSGGCARIYACHLGVGVGFQGASCFMCYYFKLSKCWYDLCVFHAF